MWTAPTRWQYGRSFGPVTNQFRIWRKTPRQGWYFMARCWSWTICPSPGLTDWRGMRRQRKWELEVYNQSQTSTISNQFLQITLFTIFDQSQTPAIVLLQKLLYLYSLFSICNQSQATAVVLRYFPSGCSTARSWPLPWCLTAILLVFAPFFTQYNP